MKKIPLLDMKAQLTPIRKELDEAISRVIDNSQFILGKEVESFENEVCRYTGSKYAIGVSNGTDAITLALETAGIGKADKVVCPAFTYYATAGAIVRLGAEPVFVDIDPMTYCISPESIISEARRQKSEDRIKAIISVHLYGQCADMDKILKTAAEYGLKVIEDTAQAFGAVYKGRRAGIMGDCGTVSFYPGKNLGAYGDAGMVLTSDRNIAQQLRSLRNQGADTKDKYRHIYLGHNNRLDAIQAAILRIKLRYLDRWNKKRVENAAYYNDKLKDTDLRSPVVPAGNRHIYHQYVLRAKNLKQRDKIINHLKEKGIDSRVFYPIPLHLQPCFSYLGYKKDDLIESERASETTFALPVYAELTKEDLDYIIGSIKEVL